MKKDGREVREVHLDPGDHKIAKLKAVEAGVKIGDWVGAAIRHYARAAAPVVTVQTAEAGEDKS